MHTSPIFAHHIRSWLPCIPVDNIISGRTAVTKPRRIEWKRFFFCEVGTAVWPREFYHGNLLLKQSAKIPVAIPRFLLRKKKKTPSFDSPWFGLSCGAFAIVYSSFGNFVMVGSPRFPKSSGIDPKKALVFSSVWAEAVAERYSS